MLPNQRPSTPTYRPATAPLDMSRGGSTPESPRTSALKRGPTAAPGQEHAHAGSLGISYKDFVGRDVAENGPETAPETQQKQAETRRPLSRYRLQRFAAELAPRHGGLRSCFWLLAMGAGAVSLKGQPQGDGTFDRPRLGNLTVCGSHMCPVCGPRLAETRTGEVEAVMGWAARQGLHAVFLTLTTANKPTDRLSHLADAQRRAMRRWKQHRAYKNRKAALAGIVSAFETTHGRNGWHPHMHLLLLVRAQTMGRALRLVAGLRAPWKAAAEAEGLTVGRAGFKAVAAASDPARVAGYFTKWNAASEMTRADKKQGKNKGRTPAQLLSDAYKGDDAAAVLWAEYAEAMKGKSVLRFSPGLKAAAGLLDMSDEDAATPAPDEAARLIDLIDGGLWNEARANGLDRNDLLRAAKKGRDAVRQYLIDLRAAAAWNPLE